MWSFLLSCARMKDLKFRHKFPDAARMVRQAQFQCSCAHLYSYDNNGFMSKLPSLKKNNEYRKIYARGKYAVSASLVMYTLPNRIGATRIGITTSKKVGNSVERNRIRRLIRENLRLIFPELITGIDLVAVARKADPDAGLQSIGKEIRYLLKKLDILNKGLES